MNELTAVAGTLLVISSLQPPRVLVYHTMLTHLHIKCTSSRAQSSDASSEGAKGSWG